MRKLQQRTLTTVLATTALVVVVAPVGLALTGGMPGAHSVSGRDFGRAVSDYARIYPGAVADHVSDPSPEASSEHGGGMPAAHGMTGRQFGAAVSGLAKSAPGAVAAHVGGAGAEGTPKAHGLSGAEFGGAVSGLAQSGSGAVADHVSSRRP